MSTNQSGFSIDWIAYTFKWEAGLPEITAYYAGDKRSDSVAEALIIDMVSAAARTWGGVWVIGAGRYGYQHSAIHDSGVLVLWGDELRQGVHVVFDGKALSMRDALWIVGQAYREGAKFTRIDICYDDMSADVTPVHEYVARYSGGEYMGRKRKWSEISSSGGGHTLYIGVRSSNRMMRIYDKGAQLDVGSNWWVRHEIELKGDAAQGAALYLSKSGSDGAHLAAIVADFVKFPSSTADRDMPHMGVNICYSDKGSRKTKEWGINAIKAISTQMKLDQDYMRDITNAFAWHGLDATFTVS